MGKAEEWNWMDKFGLCGVDIGIRDGVLAERFPWVPFIFML